MYHIRYVTESWKRLYIGFPLSGTREKIGTKNVRDKESQLYMLYMIIYYIGLLPIKLDTYSFVWYSSGTLYIRNRNKKSTTCRPIFNTIYTKRKFFIAECISLPFSSPCFFSKSTFRQIYIIYYPSWQKLHSPYPM